MLKMTDYNIAICLGPALLKVPGNKSVKARALALNSKKQCVFDNEKKGKTNTIQSSHVSLFCRR